METDLSRARSLSGVDPNTGQLQVTMEKVLFHEHTLVTVFIICFMNRLRNDWLL